MKPEPFTVFAAAISLKKIFFKIVLLEKDSEWVAT